MDSESPSPLRLQEATLAIEAAYQRIEQARRSLRDIATRNSTPPTSFDPGHRAILLANTQPEHTQDQPQTESSEFDEIVDRFLNAISDRNSARVRRFTSDLRALSASNPAWSSLLLPPQTQRRSTVVPPLPSEDDGLTMHGRIVAGRFMSSAPTTDEPNADHAPDLSSSATQAPQDRPALGRLQMPPPSTPPTSERSYPPLFRNFRLARTDNSSPGARTNTSSSGRLSLLSNSSMYHNFQTPTSSVSREQSLLLFDEPATMSMEQERRRSILNPPEPGESRNYTLIRRYDERGDEIVAQVSMPNEPSLPFATRRPQRTAPNGSNDPLTQSRRRLFTATDTSSPIVDDDYWGFRPYDPSNLSRPNALHDPQSVDDYRSDDVTRTAHFPGLSNFEISKAYDVDGSGEEIIYIGSAKPFKANPLPLPLPDLTTVKPAPPKPPRAISRQASLAAR